MPVVYFDQRLGAEQGKALLSGLVDVTETSKLENSATDHLPITATNILYNVNHVFMMK